MQTAPAHLFWHTLGKALQRLTLCSLCAATFVLVSKTLEASQATHIWEEQARTWGQWELTKEGHNYAEFSPNGSNGSAHLVLNYTSQALDLSEYVYAAVEVSNQTTGELDITISALSNPAQAWSNQNQGRFILSAGESDPLRVFMLRESMDSQSPWRQTMGNLYAFPGGHQRHWRFLETDSIKRIQIAVTWKQLSGNSNQIRIGMPHGDTALETNDAQFQSLPTPLIDAMGQFRGETWEGKADQSNTLTQDGVHDLATYAQYPVDKQMQLSRYGGWLDGPQLEATGRFRTHKQDDKWWLVDPEGYLFWSLGITEAGIGSLTRIEDREALFPELRDARDAETWVRERGTLSYNFYHSNLKTKYGDDWQSKHHAVTEGRMRAWGLNTIGAWSMEPNSVFGTERPTVPYTLIVHTDLFGGLGNLHEMVDPFSPQFEKSLKSTLSREAQKYNGDPNNIGIFVNNELNWVGGIQLPLEVLKLKNHVPAKRALRTQLKKRYENITKLNRAWGSAFKNFESINQQGVLTSNAAFRKDMEAYLSLFAEAFFSKCAQAVKQHFPGHMYLGCRFNVFHPLVTRAASRHCDAISFNLYQNSVANFKAQTDNDCPYLISEFHFGSGSYGVWGRGLTPCADLDNQTDLYGAYVEDALKHPNFVGAHWFTWADQPATGRYDGENFRVGLVSIIDRPYQALVERIQQTARNMFRTRLED
jgi:hypothetical protein